MQEFDFLRATDINNTCELLANKGKEIKLIAGGTDLMIDLKKNKLTDEIKYILDISKIEEINYIREEDDYIKIGALVTHTDISKNQLILENASFLCKAASKVGSPQVRNRGTIGGNIITASPAADIIPVLITLDASCVFRSKENERVEKIIDIFKKPNLTNIKNDEILCEIRFKKPDKKAREDFYKLTRRNAVDKARINIAVIALQNDLGLVEDIRISVGSITPVPCRFKNAEEVLLGNAVSKELLKIAACKITEKMIESSGYRWSTEYKKPVVESMVIRTLGNVLEVS